MYFAYGWEARPDISSQTTFDAILEGERTSTTRYDEWRGSEDWGKLKKGDLVRFYEDKHMTGRSVVVAVDSVERINMKLMDEKQRADWSKAEGWSELHAKKSAERHSGGFQIRYRPVPGQEILEGRGAERLAMEAEGSKPDFKIDKEADMKALTGGRVSFNRQRGMAAALSQGLGR